MRGGMRACPVLRGLAEHAYQPVCRLFGGRVRHIRIAGEAARGHVWLLNHLHAIPVSLACLNHCDVGWTAATPLRSSAALCATTRVRHLRASQLAQRGILRATARLRARDRLERIAACALRRRRREADRAQTHRAAALDRVADGRMVPWSAGDLDLRRTAVPRRAIVLSVAVRAAPSEVDPSPDAHRECREAYGETGIDDPVDLLASLGRREDVREGGADEAAALQQSDGDDAAKEEDVGEAVVPAAVPRQQPQHVDHKRRQQQQREREGALAAALRTRECRGLVDGADKLACFADADSIAPDAIVIERRRLRLSGEMVEAAFWRVHWHWQSSDLAQWVRPAGGRRSRVVRA
mmetsp:Transcript_16429/g.34851  ORF Transcript_16429/g.34851 Transcript_16429/m.34851 type:complete len:352 (-) Transcript_16429:2167-3222(-)